jgi:hypothetical protein
MVWMTVVPMRNEHRGRATAAQELNRAADLGIEPESEQADNIRRRMEELTEFVDSDAARLAGP